MKGRIIKGTLVILVVITICVAIWVQAEYEHYDQKIDTDEIEDNYGNRAWLKVLARGHYNSGDPHYRRGDAGAERGYEDGSVGYVEWADVLWYTFEFELADGTTYYEDGCTLGDYAATFYERPLGYGDPIVVRVISDACTAVKINSPDDLPVIPLEAHAEVVRDP